MTLMQWLLLPAFVHVGLVFFVGIRMGRARFAAARAGKVKVKDIALDSSRWPEDALKFQNNFNNQFQVPVLWYALLPLLLVTGKADWVAVALSWAFVASRIVHAFIHTGSNAIIRRFQAFVAGFSLVALMWVWFAVRLYVTD